MYDCRTRFSLEKQLNEDSYKTKSLKKWRGECQNEPLDMYGQMLIYHASPPRLNCFMGKASSEAKIVIVSLTVSGRQTAQR